MRVDRVQPSDFYLIAHQLILLIVVDSNVKRIAHILVLHLGLELGVLLLLGYSWHFEWVEGGDLIDITHIDLVLLLVCLRNQIWSRELRVVIPGLR